MQVGRPSIEKFCPRDFEIESLTRKTNKIIIFRGKNMDHFCKSTTYLPDNLNKLITMITLGTNIREQSSVLLARITNNK